MSKFITTDYKVLITSTNTVNFLWKSAINGAILFLCAVYSEKILNSKELVEEACSVAEQLVLLARIKQQDWPSATKVSHLNRLRRVMGRKCTQV